MSRRELRAAAVLLAASIAASRVLGFLREVIIAYVLGAGAETDAYLAAFVVPDLINHFLAGGALSTALLPLYLRQAEADSGRAWRLVSQTITVSCAVLSVALVAAWFATPALVAKWYPGFDPEQVALTTRLTRIILPGPLLFTVGALLNATEQARRRFWATALMPLIYNACIIVAGLVLGPTLGVDAFAWGVLAGALLGPFAVPWIATRDIARVRPWLDPSDADLRRFVVLALPVMFSSSLLFFDEWFGRRFASALDEGTITWLNNARRLVLLPASMVGQAAGQALFPFVAAMIVESRRDELQHTMASIVRATAALGVVAAFALASLAVPLVGAIFVRGAYTPADAAITAQLLAVMAWSVPAWALYAVALRALHAAQRTWLSSAIGLSTLVPSYFAYAALAESACARGLAAATPVCLTVAALVLLAVMSRALRVSTVGPLVRGLAEGVAVGVAGAAAALGVAAALDTRATVEGALSATAFGAAAAVVLALLPGPAGDVVRVRLRRVRARLSRG